MRASALLAPGIAVAAAGIGSLTGRSLERRYLRRPLISPALEADEDLGRLHNETQWVTADDGVRLRVEVDEADPHAAPMGRDDVTVVFTHGFCLCLDCWHYQRAALRGRVRMVFWDHRGHGGSQRGAPDSATIEQLGADLGRVLDAVVPTGPVVLVGHSMGGMTIMALAARHPELFADRVAGAVLIATSSGGLMEQDLGIALLGRHVIKAVPSVLQAAAGWPRVVDGARSRGNDLEEWLVHRWSFGGPVAPQLLDLTARMIAGTRMEVISELMPQFSVAQGHWALTALEQVPVVIIAGDRDCLVPPEHSDRLADALSHATYERVPGSNHLVMLERPEVLNRHLVQLLGRIGSA